MEKIKEYLKDNCDCYEIVCIVKGTDQNLGEIERKFGFKYKVLFWSDRKHYECTKEEIEERRKKYVEENKFEIDEKKYEVLHKCVI